MITTLFFLQLIAFQIWYVTSSQVKYTNPPTYVHYILRHRQTFRMAGLVLMLISTSVLVTQFGWMSGICAGIVGLMGAACLVVLLNPFRYLNERKVVVLFVLFLALEFLI
jgi:hypothetical protein